MPDCMLLMGTEIPLSPACLMPAHTKCGVCGGSAAVTAVLTRLQVEEASQAVKAREAAADGRAAELARAQADLDACTARLQVGALLLGARHCTMLSCWLITQ